MIIQVIIIFLLKTANMEKEVKGFPLYTISNNGSVRSLITNKILKPQKTGPKNKVYLSVSFRKEGKSVQAKIHRLVAEAFIPNPENKPTVNHLDFDKFNNNDWNLEWATYAEQEAHKIKAGRGNHVGGGKHNKAIPIYQFTKEGNFIKKFECVMDAARELGVKNCCTMGIINTAKNPLKGVDSLKTYKRKYKISYGFAWCLEEKLPLPKIVNDGIVN